MLRSEDRILTTHTGSLPRPAALTSLYVRRSRGEAIDAGELDREGKAAVREVVAKQIAAGVDVPNNGEQQREAFFLYVRHRMSGFGGGWTRKVFADVTHYPAFMAWKAAHDAVNEFDQQRRRHTRGSRRSALPGLRAGGGRMRGFPCRARCCAGALCRTLHDSALAWHHRRGHAQRLVRHGRCVPCRTRSRVAGRIRNHRLKRLRAADRCARSRHGAPHLLPGPAARRIRWLRRARGGDDQRGTRQCGARPGAAARVLGELRRPARLRCGSAGRYCRRYARRKWVASCCRSPTRATRTNTAA